VRDRVELLLRAKERLGRVVRDTWRLDDLVGVGGMGAVYAATPKSGKRVAVKMMHRELVPNETARTRFLREAYVANKVRHPGAVSVLEDDVDEDGSLFLVMDLLEGETVQQYWVRHGKQLEIEQVAWIVDRLLDVLANAHGHQIVHRDIKPENVFLTHSGALKVLDFGFAQLLEGASNVSKAWAVGRLTMQGIIVGTPAFMSPEHAAGARDIDGRCDLWSVGATMFTLLSGRHVHEAAGPIEQLRAAIDKPARSLRAVRPDLPSEVIALVDRALAFDRADRWRDANEMRQALSNVQPRPATLREAERAQPRSPVLNSKLPKLYDDEDELALQPTELGNDKPLDDPMSTTSGALIAGDGSYDELCARREPQLPVDSRHRPTMALAYVNRGVAFFERGDTQRAMRDFGAAIDVDPGCALAFYDRGLLRQSIGHLVLAISDYTGAIRIDPSLAAAWYNRAVAQLALEHLDEARSDACRAFALYRQRGDLAGTDRARRLVKTTDMQGDGVR
jgi:serine/threonine protein kinase